MSTDAPAFTQISYDVDDRVATITLDRPDRLNAFTPTMARELIAAYDRADADDAVRAIVLTGRGRGFCAGADLGRGGASFDPTDPQRAADRAGVGTIGGVVRDGGGTVTMRMAALRTPVIAAVNGPAVGIGATMTLPADIRLAGASARFGFVFARRGLVPEAASSWFLPRIVGVSRAMEWAATGRVFDAAEALDGRLVSRVLPDDELLGAAYAIAREIADNTSAVSVALTRQLLWGMLGAPSPWDAHRADSAAIAHLGQGRDVAEGVTSFLEKRPPAFPDTVSDDYPGHVLPHWPAPPADLTD
ncbi:MULTISPECIES: enoyl-CoA hydratase-related protein [Pseudonocardia]|uniref:Enoyl-CoA hydratase/carnithine racemase n=1 Tax=Pseudonocardia alni TaxID=33907 RepID=A0A852W7H6_PSEA5|nr:MULTISPECIES: enoyl-CoA hydratase-related protein [Pseudonocardia]MCO7195300.1 enoyl-CoA hydratase-related protein [Pseudonocardia sp. McavD-2-B]NYG04510.1 enoyl-CoA hydratase/carnithine racemase [Pseudonocardia antarctica]